MPVENVVPHDRARTTPEIEKRLDLHIAYTKDSVQAAAKSAQFALERAEELVRQQQEGLREELQREAAHLRDIIDREVNTAGAMRLYIEKLMESRFGRVEERFLSLQQAVDKAERSDEARFRGINEFRAALSDQQKTLVSRDTVDVMVGGIMDRLERLNTRIEQMDKVAARPEALSAVASNVESLKLFVSNLQGRFWAIGAVITLISLGLAIVGFVLSRLQ